MKKYISFFFADSALKADLKSVSVERLRFVKVILHHNDVQVGRLEVKEIHHQGPRIGQTFELAGVSKFIN